MSAADFAAGTVAELAEGLRRKAFSAVELTEAVLARIAASQPVLNAFVSIDGEGALAAARAADAARAQGNAGELSGIPLAHKDLFMTEGLRTTCSSRMLEHFVAPFDAHVVAALKDAGTVLVGKTAMDEFAMGGSTETSYFGPVKNPWNPAAVPGGSSGGSAAAVAARLLPAATGSDTGGSIRQPASFTGICGLKPTYGICSRHGMVAFASSLDQAGPMARSAEDCALLLTAMAGHDPRDATSLAHPREDYARELRRPLSGAAAAKPLAGLRIGVPEIFFGEGVDRAVAEAVRAALGELEALGAAAVTVELPNIAYSVPTYYVLAPAEASSNLSRFDGVRYGHRAAHYTDLLDMYKKTRAEGFGEEVKRRVLVGTYVLSHGYYDAYYLKAQKVRRLIADDYQKAFARCDAVLGPTVPTTAPRLGEQTHDPIKMYLNDIFTIGANLAGLPALSVPCGFAADGLPIGLQLQGPYFSEARLLDIAHRFQQATDWHRRAPAATEVTK